MSEFSLGSYSIDWSLYTPADKGYYEFTIDMVDSYSGYTYSADVILIIHECSKAAISTFSTDPSFQFQLEASGISAVIFTPNEDTETAFFAPFEAQLAELGFDYRFICGEKVY